MRELLHQQLWCWGRDVMPGPGGPPVNLLLAYGLERHRPAAGGTASSRYASPLIGGGARVHLWAFGVCVEDGRGSVFLHCYHRGPRVPPLGWSAAAASGRPEDVRMFPRARTPTERDVTARLLDRFLRWTAGYEAWVARTLGGGYRSRTLARWEHPAIPGAGMANAWSTLADAHRRATAPFVIDALTVQPQRIYSWVERSANA